MSQTSGVFVYDAHFPVPLLGRLPAAEALALAAPYGRPALVPGAFRFHTQTEDAVNLFGASRPIPIKSQLQRGFSIGQRNTATDFHEHMCRNRLTARVIGM